jgi:carboxyl-terminal processing protease
MGSRTSWRPRTAALAVALVVALVAGVWLGGHPSWIPSSIRGTFSDQGGPKIVNEVLGDLSKDYYRPVDQNGLMNLVVNKGLESAVASLNDPYSHYFDPTDYRSFQNEDNPHLSGIGVDVLPNPHGLEIVDVFPGSPAAKAGLGHGDLIVAVGGTSLQNRSSTFASAKIRGPAGSKVTLTIVSHGQRHMVTITRQDLVVPVAAGRLVDYHGKKLGYLQFTSFTQGSGDELRTQVHKVLSQGAQGLILDLRENGGGLLNEAINVASIFLADGTIVSTRGRDQPSQVYVAQGNALAPTMPLVVLVDRDTASSAEIVTAALKDRGRALVVGTHTYGKGVFQELMPLSNGGALDITVGEYFTPNGQNLGGRGVVQERTVAEGVGIPPNVYASQNPRSSVDHQLSVAERTVAAEIK